MNPTAAAGLLSGRNEPAPPTMDSAATIGPSPRDSEPQDVLAQARTGRCKDDDNTNDRAQTIASDEHAHQSPLLLQQQLGQAVQAMERLSAAVERSSSELDEFRAAQRQTLQVLTEIRNNTCNASSASTASSQRRESAVTGTTRACATMSDEGDDDDASFSFKDDDADKSTNSNEEPPDVDHSQVLDRKRDRLDGLEVYAVVSAISAGTMVAVFDSYQPAGGDVFDLFHHGRYLEFLMSTIFLVTGSIGIVCALHCIFIFSLVTMYGRTAIGMDRDDALDVFFAGTGVQRFHGFKTFVGSLYALMFQLIVVITSKVSDKPFVHLLAVIVTSRLMYNVYRDTQIVMDKASVIFALSPQASSDSTKGDDASLSLGSIDIKDDDDVSITPPELINDEYVFSPTDPTPSASISSSLDLRSSDSLSRRPSVRRISGFSSMTLGAEEVMLQKQKEEVPPAQKKGRASILVVDDSATSRRLLVKRVEKLGHVASQAADGEEALDMLRDAASGNKPGSQYDLVLLDNYMPKLNGDEVLEEMQKNKDLQNIPVIMISGNEDVAQKAKCIELGASDFLPKPFDTVIFKARVVACLQARRLQELQESADDTSGAEDASHTESINNASIRSLGSFSCGKKSGRRRRSTEMSMNLGAEQLIEKQRQAKQAPKILVVDDSATSRRLLAKRVEKLGRHVVETASDGPEALDLLKGSKKSGEGYDLVLLDMFMPKLNGDKVLEEMRKHKALQNIPVIMISGAEDVSQKARCIELGASDFLPKPFDPIIFKARVVACLRAKRLRERRGEVE